jgi:hypothetical protein
MAQHCNREEIGVQLQVAANKINNAKCPEFNDLHDALKELSGLLKNDDVASQTASESASAAPALAPVPDFKKENSEQRVKSSVANVSWNYARLMKEIEEVLTSGNSSEVMKEKYKKLKPIFENATTFEDVKRLTEDNVKFYSNSIYSGGTRRRKTSQRKRAKTLKNKKKVGKRK